MNIADIKKCVKIKIMKALIIFLVVLFASCPVWATPVTHLQLGYNIDTHTLYIEGDHPTDRDRHFIQRVLVTKNSKEKKDFYFSHQSRADKFIAEINYTAIEGDHLDVEVYCSQGGVAQEGIDIKAPTLKKEINEKTISIRK
jgi:hypothetical protein